MKKTVYLHIGSPKTGTTAIQEVLTLNREALLEKGYLYPKTCAGGINHYKMPELIQHRDPSRVQIFADIVKEFEDSNVKNMIISSEGFFYRLKRDKHLNELKNAFNDYDIKIVAYVRRQDNFLQSAYSQEVKARTDRIMNIKKYFKTWEKHFNHFDKISFWADFFGQENIILQPYEKSQMPEGLIANFFQHIGIENDINSYLTLPEKKSNVGLSNYETELLRIFNKYKVAEKTKNKFVEHFLSKNENPQPYTLFSYKEKLDIIENYAESNERLAREYLNRDDGVLFYEKPEDNNFDTKIRRKKLRECYENACENISLSLKDKVVLNKVGDFLSKKSEPSVLSKVLSFFKI